MKTIQRMINHANDTLNEIEEYYRDYVIYKDSNPKVATLSIELARIHANIYDKIHSVIVGEINTYKDKGNEIPKSMQEIWDYEHKRLTEKFTDLQKLLNRAN